MPYLTHATVQDLPEITKSADREGHRLWPADQSMIDKMSSQLQSQITKAKRLLSPWTTFWPPSLPDLHG